MSTDPPFKMTDSWISDAARRLLVCRYCQYAINPSAKKVQEHLTKRHMDVYPTKESRDNAFQEIPDIGVAYITPNNIKAIEAIHRSGLPPYLVRYYGYGCEICDDYYSDKFDTVRKHLLGYHGFEKKQALTYIEHGVSVAKVFAEPPRWRAVGTDSYDRIDEFKFANDSADTIWQQHQQQRRKERATIPFEPDPSHNLWVKRCRWAETFGGCNMTYLCDIYRVPNKPALAAITKKLCLKLLHECWQDANDAPEIHRQILYSYSQLPSEPLKIITKRTLEARALYWTNLVLLVLDIERVKDCEVEVSKDIMSSITKCRTTLFDLYQRLKQLQDTDGKPQDLESEALAAPVEAAKRAIIHLSHHIITQDLSRTRNIHRSPVLFYIGILGYKFESCGWRGPDEIRPMLSGIIYIMRIINYRFIKMTLPDKSRDDVENYDSILERSLRSLQAEHMYQEQARPFNEVFRLSMDAKSKYQSIDRHPAMALDKSRATLDYKMMRIDVARFFSSAQPVLEELEASILKLVARPRSYLDSRRPERFFDTPSMRNPEECFADMDVNGVRDGYNRVRAWHQQNAADVDFFRIWVRADKDVWKLNANGKWHFYSTIGRKVYYTNTAFLVAEEWLKCLDQVVDNLVFLTALLAPGARGTELASVDVRNNINSLRRGVRIYEGLVIVMPLYNKTDNHTQRSKAIPRFLPHRLSTLLVAYVCDVLPFSERLRFDQGRCKSIGFTQSTRLFQRRGRQIESGEISDIVRTGFGRAVGHELGLQESRQVITMLRTRFVDPTFNKLSSQYQQNKDESAATAGHSAAVEEEHYAIDLAGYYGDSESVLYPPRLVFCGWHACFVPNLHTEFARNVRLETHPFVTGIEARVAEALSPAPAATIKAKTVKAQQTKEEEVETPPRVEKRPHNQSWDAADGTVGVGRKRDAPKPARSKSPDVKAVSRSDNVARAFEKLEILHGQGSQWRSGQLEAVLAVLEQETSGSSVQDVIIRLKASAGKTDAIAIPLLLNPGTVSVLITPYIAAREDVRRRLEENGINCVNFTPRFGEMQLICATPGSAASDPFWQLLAQLRRQNRLYRVFIDEAHTLVTDDEWRRDIAKFVEHSESWRVEDDVGLIPRVFLTGTLPDAGYERLRQVMRISPSARYVKHPTCRRDIALSVEGLPSNAVIDMRLCELVAGNGTARTAIFCHSLEVVTKLQGFLRQAGFAAFAYTAAMSVEQRRATLLQLEGTPSGVVVATSALGTGVNISNLTLVVIRVKTYSVFEMAQQLFRAGRNGEKAKGVLLWVNKNAEQPTPEEKGRLSEKRAVHNFATTDSCRISALSDALDDDYTITCLPQHLCDNCERLQSILPADSPDFAAVTPATPPKSSSTKYSRPQETPTVGEPQPKHARLRLPHTPNNNPTGGKLLIGTTKAIETPRSLTASAKSHGGPLRWDERHSKTMQSNFEGFMAMLGDNCLYCHWGAKLGSPDAQSSSDEMAFLNGYKMPQHSWKKCPLLFQWAGLSDEFDSGNESNLWRSFPGAMKKRLAPRTGYPDYKNAVLRPAVCWTCYFPKNFHGQQSHLNCDTQGVPFFILAAASNMPDFHYLFADADVETPINFASGTIDDKIYDALARTKEESTFCREAPVVYLQLLYSILEELVSSLDRVALKISRKKRLGQS